MNGGGWPEQPSPRFIFHRLLRRKDLCPTPAECPEVLMEDPYADSSALPCDHCPEQALQDYLVSPGGRLISAVIDLHFALQMPGCGIGLEKILYHEFLLLRLLVEERDRYELEQIRKEQDRHGR